MATTTKTTTKARKPAAKTRYIAGMLQLATQADLAAGIEWYARAERFARRHELHWFNLPVNDVPPVETHLYWHESTDQDPANRWMREQLIELAQQISAQEKKAAEPA